MESGIDRVRGASMWEMVMYPRALVPAFPRQSRGFDHADQKMNFWTSCAGRHGRLVTMVIVPINVI